MRIVRVTEYVSACIFVACAVVVLACSFADSECAGVRMHILLGLIALLLLIGAFGGLSSSIGDHCNCDACDCGDW